MVTKQVGQWRGSKQEMTDILRFQEFLKMNPQSVTGSNTIKDLENFIEKLKKVF